MGLRFGKVGVAAVFVLLLGFVPCWGGTEGGLRYYGSDPYAALPVARQQRKLLLVEFYADWNHRSRWMGERVLADSALRPLIEDNFVAVRVLTGTAEGAELAGVYQVTGYPAILIFNANGDVLDKIDVTLDGEDLDQRLRTVLMTVQGMGTWRLRQIYSAAERADRAGTDAAVAEFLGGQLPRDVANGVVWPMFENSVVSRYGSTAFNYLVANLGFFRDEVGRDKVDGVITEALQEALLPYAIGSVPYAADVAGEVVATAQRLDLPAALILGSMSDMGALRGDKDLSLFVGRLGLLLDLVPESYQLPLVLSLDMVAQRGSRDDRSAALRIVQRALTVEESPSNASLLENLSDRLK